MDTAASPAMKRDALRQPALWAGAKQQQQCLWDSDRPRGTTQQVDNAPRGAVEDAGVETPEEAPLRCVVADQHGRPWRGSGLRA